MVVCLSIPPTSESVPGREWNAIGRHKENALNIQYKVKPQYVTSVMILIFITRRMMF